MAYYYTPFRKKYGHKKQDAGCPFCDEQKMHSQSVKYSDGIVVENKHYRWVVNFFPKFEGHTLLIPKKHVVELGTESAKETKAREELLKLASVTLQKLYPGSGIEVFLQTGDGSQATVSHLHWHIVPSSPGDPLRSFDKLGYFYTIEADQPRVLIFPVPIKRARNNLIKALAKVLGRKEAPNEVRADGRRS